jgi:hypothetical protein
MKELMIDRGQIKKIHTLVSVLRIPDELYRQMLSGTFHVFSSKEMTRVQARRFILLLEDFTQTFHRGEKPYCEAHFGKLGFRPGMASVAQLRKIEVMWNALYPAHHTEDGQISLRGFLNRQFKVSDLRFLDGATAGKVLGALYAIRARKMKPIKNAQDALNRPDSEEYSPEGADRQIKRV